MVQILSRLCGSADSIDQFVNCISLLAFRRRAIIFLRYVFSITHLLKSPLRSNLKLRNKFVDNKGEVLRIRMLQHPEREPVPDSTVCLRRKQGL